MPSHVLVELSVTASLHQASLAVWYLGHNAMDNSGLGAAGVVQLLIDWLAVLQLISADRLGAETAPGLLAFAQEIKSAPTRAVRGAGVCMCVTKPVYSSFTCRLVTLTHRCPHRPARSVSPRASWAPCGCFCSTVLAQMSDTSRMLAGTMCCRTCFRHPPSRCATCSTWQSAACGRFQSPKKALNLFVVQMPRRFLVA